MAEKVLNTRILMKVDTLENWNSSTLKLKKGELAFATVASSAGTGLTEPVVMVKIGTEEEKTFSELPWSFYAKASDVLTACKSEAGLQAFVKDVIDGADMADNAKFKALSDKVDGLAGDIETLNGDADTNGSVANAIKTAIDALDLANTYAAKEHTHTKAEITDFAHGHVIGDVDGLQAALDGKQAVGDYATKTEAQGYANAKDDAIQAAKDAADAAQESADNLAAYVGEFTAVGTETTVVGYIDAKTANIASDATVNALTDRVKAIEDDYLVGADKTELSNAIGTEKSRAEGVEAGLQSAIDAINSTENGILKQAKDYADGKDATIQAAHDAADAAQGDVDALAAKVGEVPADKTVVQMIADAKAEAVESATYDDTQVKADIKANADAIDLLNDGSTVAGSVDYKIAQAVAAIMENPDETKNSINELVTWINGHAEDALEMSNQVEANKDAIEVLNGDASTAGSVAKQIADAVAVEKDRAEGVEGGLDTRLQTVEAAVGANGAVDQKIAAAIAAENLSQYATDTELSALDGRVVVVENAINTATTGLKARMDAAEADIDALEAKVDTGDQKVSEYVAAAIAALSIGDYAKAADLTAAITQHNTDKAALEGAIALKANDADLAAIAKTGNVNDLIQSEGDVLVFNCGTSV